MDVVVSQNNCVINEFCRLCASKSKTGITIYSPEGNAQCLEEKINYCLRIAVTEADLLPKHICFTCQSRLDDYHKFTEDVKKVQKSLQIFLQTKNLDILHENSAEHSDRSLMKSKEDSNNSMLETVFKNVQNSPYIDDTTISNSQLESDSNLHVDTNHQNIVLDNNCKYQLKIDQTSENVDDIVVPKVLKETTNKAEDSKEINQNELSKIFQPDDDDNDLSDDSTNEKSQSSGIKCNQCSIVIASKSQFDLHYQTSYNKKPIYTCSLCNKTIEKYTTFRSHCYRHMTEGRFRCEFCKKGFYLRNLLDLHIASKHTKVKAFICESCGKGFVTHIALNNHIKSHTAKIKEEFPCEECGKVLFTRGGLKSHTNAHKLGRRFMCDLCGKTFTQKVNMQHHVKIHYGERPYACDKCDKSFSEKSHLNRHYNFHSDKRPFKCSVCSKMYKTERCLKVHNLVHSNIRPYVCSLCSKGFLSITKLKQHNNIHTGERPYKCNYCDRTFTNFPNWLKHTRRRHKVNHKTGEVMKQQTEKEITISESFPPSDVKAFEDNKQEENIYYTTSTLTYSTQLNTGPSLLYTGQNLNNDIFILPQQMLIL